MMANEASLEKGLNQSLTVGSLSRLLVRAGNLLSGVCFKSLGPPSVSTGERSVFMSWDNGHHHLEAEVEIGKPNEWFYRNRDTGEIAGDTFGDSSWEAYFERLAQ
ncbi:MAG: hypothetical protein E6R03_01940 [Hyphomicrobiaceae bacterium]|nr:MAG: hypothetical protein E6R03_01940 [Hyphomicrobiaceae bacterium]